MYKVFLVEDELFTREGIRNNVKWKEHGFELCGEASDGEMALVQLQTIKPDILITDIKMPFMDGLQLGKIIREKMPSTKIVILSGHDEFEYAQEAIKIGVTEYLLKPITVHDMHKVLQRLASKLDREKREEEALKKLQERLDEDNSLIKERLLLKVVTGAINPAEAIEEGQAVGLELVARYYCVVILRIKIDEGSGKFNFEEYQQNQNAISGLVGNNPDIFLLKKDWNELVLLIKGNIPQYIEEERELLLDSILKLTGEKGYQLIIGIGQLKERIVDIYKSFIEAFININQAVKEEKGNSHQDIEIAELLKINKSAVETFLKCGIKEDFEEFYNTYLQPLGETALKSFLIKNYLFMDIVVATINLLSALGGEIETVIPELNSIEALLENIKSSQQFKAEINTLLLTAIQFRDSQTGNQHARLLQQAKEYIEQHFSEPDLSLYDLASQANLSTSHFSMVFSQGTCQTFKEYLTSIRINKAKELLRTTLLSANEISYRVGFNDPHYFSYVFKKNMGLSPTEYRSKL